MDHNETLLPSAALRTCVTLQSFRNAGLDAAAALPMMIPGNTWRGNVVQTLDFRICELHMKWNIFLEWLNTVSHLISINPRKGKAEGGDFCRLTLPGEVQKSSHKLDKLSGLLQGSMFTSVTVEVWACRRGRASRHQVRSFLGLRSYRWASLSPIADCLSITGERLYIIWDRENRERERVKQR